MATATKRKVSPLLAAYRSLVRKKSQFCAGKATKTEVESAASKYVQKAQAAGQTATEAKRKATRVTSGGCKMSSVAGARRKKTTTGKKSATTRRRTR